MLTFKNFRTWAKVKLIPFGQSFTEFHDNILSEATADWDDIHHPRHGVFNVRFSADQKKAVNGYCRTPSESRYGEHSSGNMNSYLRHRSGDEASKIVGGHHEEHVHAAIKKFGSVFTKENTNRRAVTTHAGVHPRAGREYEKMKSGDKFSMAGFQSSSTEPSIAKGFARQHLREKNGDVKPDTPDEDKHIHVLVMHHEPHSCISVASHSHYDHERECVTHHGAHCEYMHSEKKPPENERDRDSGVKSVTYHHIRVISHLDHHTKLEEYPHPYVNKNIKIGGKHPAFDGEKHFFVDPK